MTRTLKETVFEAMDNGVDNGYADTMQSFPENEVAVDMLDSLNLNEYGDVTKEDLVIHIRAWRHRQLN